ncbi:MAG: hypothetical protein VYB06_06265 [Cyanobacteriota bacterium]|nr:hypothetical protein [Cyanobacteriota bacterium]
MVYGLVLGRAIPDLTFSVLGAHPTHQPISWCVWADLVCGGVNLGLGLV